VKIATNSNSGAINSVTIGASNNANSIVSIDAGNTGGIHIGDGDTAHSIYIGSGGTSTAQTVAIGSTSSSSASYISSGTSNIQLTSNGSSAGTLIKSEINSTAAFQVQNSGTGNLLTVDTSDSNINLGQLTTGALAAWQSASNQIPSATQSFGIASGSGYVYVIGGYSGGSQPTVYYSKFSSDGSTGSWQTNTNSLPLALQHPGAIVANGYLYVIGGDNSSSVPQTSVYYAQINSDGSTGAWQTSANVLPVGLQQTGVTISNGYIYVIGGDNAGNGGGHVATVYYSRLSANGLIGAWNTTTSIPNGLNSIQAVSYSGYIYAVGGFDSTSGVSSVYYAKPNTDGTVSSWTTSVNPLSTTQWQASAVIASGYIYYMGGFTSAPTTTNAVYYSKINSGGLNSSWSSANNLPASTAEGGAVVNNGYTYYMGGYSGSAQSTVYYASVNGITRNNGQNSIADQLTVGNGLTVAGNTTFQPTADSTSAFSIQNSAGGSLFNIDSINSAITLDGNASGQLGQWLTNANSLPANKSDTASVVANSYIYLIGGNPSTTVLYAKLNADGTTGTWQTDTNALPLARGSTTAATANGYIYVMGGYDGGSNVVSTVYYAVLNPDGSTGVWNLANPLPQVLKRATSILANGYVYVVGGDTGAAVKSTVYYAKLNADGTLGAWQTNNNALPANRAWATSAVANGYVYVMGGYLSGTSAQ
ncbi:MAG: hypothetical protein ACREGG_03845, partial [Candidatus Saccharimonadales bacterium]